MKLNSDLILEFEESDKTMYRQGGNFTLFRDGGCVAVIDIDQANKLLRDEMSKWPEVFSAPSDGCIQSHLSYWCTMRSRVMPFRPIKQETAEDVLREFVDKYDKREFEQSKFDYIIERARKVLK